MPVFFCFFFVFLLLLLLFFILHNLKYYVIDTYRTDVIPVTRKLLNTV